MVTRFGVDDWEMICWESIPMCGAFSAKLAGYAHLVFFKRQIKGECPRSVR